MKRRCASIFSFFCGNDEHGITKGKKLEAVLNGQFVGGHGVIKTKKGGYKHDQRGAWEMKVGEQTIDDGESLSGIKKDICPSRLCGYFFLGSIHTF